MCDPVKVGSGSMPVSLESEKFVHNRSNHYPIRISRLKAKILQKIPAQAKIK